MAAIPSDNESESEVRVKFIQQIYDELLRSATTDSSRDDCNEMKDWFADKGIDYNKVKKWRRELRKIVGDFENKIKTLEEEKRKLQDDLEATREALKARNAELETQRAKNADLETNMKNHLETLGTRMDKFLDESSANNEMMEFRTDNMEATMKNHLETLEENMQKLLKDSTANIETMKVRTDSMEATMKEHLDEIGACMRSFIKPDVNSSVKLFVVFWVNEFFAVISHPRLQSRGQCSDAPRRYYIRCEVTDLRPGWTCFEKVRAALRPFFTDPTFQKIYQQRGSDKLRDFAQVTSLADNGDIMNPDYFVSCDGTEIPWKEVKNRRCSWFKEGDQIFIPDCRRRAVLLLSS